MDLQTLKNNYAIEQGYDDWADLCQRAGHYDETEFFKHENAVFILAQKEAWKRQRRMLRLFATQIRVVMKL